MVQRKKILPKVTQQMRVRLNSRTIFQVSTGDFWITIPLATPKSPINSGPLLAQA